jgi:hypothetical protein
MSIVQFLKAASTQPPDDFADTVLSLTGCGEKIVERLLFFGGAYQPVKAIPAIIVSLRRSKSPDGATFARMLIDLIAGSSARAFPTMRDDCAPIVLALRAATLEGDAVRLLQGIGRCRVSSSLLEIAASFPDRTYGDRETILNSVAKGTAYHLGHVLRDLRSREYDGIEPGKTLDRIIFGIPPGDRERILEYLEFEGLGDEARRVRELEDEPPF